MKIRFLLAVMTTAFLLAVLAGAVFAQEGEVPPPYTGLKNPFPWDDDSAQRAGKRIYQRSCQGCHGVNGGNVAAADFSTGDSSRNLEAGPDYYFQRLSEGALDKGMPPFRSSLSEEERWQVLTYLRALGQAAAPEAAPPAEAVSTEGVTLSLQAPAQADSGEPLTLKATLRDSQGKPIEGAIVKFFVNVEFFTSGLMAIGEELTNEEGIAAMEYIPRHIGEREVQASYKTIEATTTIRFSEIDKVYYQTKVGIEFPAIGEGRFIGPERLELGLEGQAPKTVFRLPTGTLFWLGPMLWIAMMVWVGYFYVLYQVFRIPVTSDKTDIDTRRVPLIGMVIVTMLGIGLLLMLVTSPISHP